MKVKLSKNEALQKYRIILSEHSNYLHKYFVHLNSDVLATAIVILFCELTKYAHVSIYGETIKNT